MIATAFDRRVDERLDRLVSGREPAPVAGPNGSAPEVEEMLVAAAALREAMPASGADPLRRQASRSAVREEADRRRVEWVHNRQVRVAHHARHKPVRGWSVGGTVLLLLAAIGAVVLGAAAGALAQFSEPDSGLYPLKRGSEQLMLALTGDPVSRADIHVELARQRLREAASMAQQHRASLAIQANRQRYGELDAAGSDLLSTKVRTSKWSQVRDRLEEEESVPPTMVERRLDEGGYKAEAQEVRSDATAFQARRKAVDQRLLPPEKANPNASPAPVPSPGA
jgi:hypothetical protein